MKRRKTGAKYKLVLVAVKNHMHKNTKHSLKVMQWKKKQMRKDENMNNDLKSLTLKV